MNPVQVWCLAARPKTLTAAVVPVLVAVALAHNEGFNLRASLFLCALLSAVCIQIGTNFVNDAIDFKRGTDTADRLGPLRVTQAGLLRADQVLRGAWICFALAALLGVQLVLAGGWPILLLGLASLGAAYAYTGGPYPLAYLGLGDVFVVLFFGLGAVGGTYYLQTHTLSVSAVVASLAMGFLATVLLAVNNLRDREGDALTHKRTLAVRFGRGFALAEITLLSLLPFVASLFWWQQGKVRAAVLPLLALPLALRLIARVQVYQGKALNTCLAQTAQLHMLYGVLLAAGLWWDA